MTMESVPCPVCCENRFSSKQALIDHLTEVYKNLSCSICKKKCSSVPQLIDHLNFDDCQRLSIVLEAVETASQDYSIEDYSQETKNELIEIDGNTLSDNHKVPSLMLGSNKMLVELFSDQSMKAQEPILVMQDGENRYIIVDGANQQLSQANSFVTKQNNDGTISLSSKEIINDDNLDVLENGMENEEVYSCNTCGVSFTSVIDHIQNYHTDQEVVVETPMEAGINDNDLPAESVMEDTNEKSVLRRMITETGDIIETPSVLKINMALQKTLLTNSIPKQEDSDASKDLEGKSHLQKALMSNSLQKHAPTTSLLKDPLGDYQTKNLGNNPENLRHVQIDKFCVSTVKNINENENDQNGPFHKVVLKEVRTKNDEKIRLYHCMSCCIYVKNLDDFKLHPCKKLKYSCPHCSVAYENSKSLCAHMKVHKVQPFIDNLKAIVNPKADTETESESVDSEGKKSFTCTICGTVFASNKSLKLHKRMHDPVKNRPIVAPIVEGDYQEEEENLKFLCDVCSKWIPEDYREIHLKSHDDTENLNCDICNKKFVSIEYLEMHMNVHNLDKVKVVKQDSSLPYSCVYCNRRFSRPHEKVKHERIHTGEKPHACEICGKSFRVSYCLTLHMRTHTGARPYACLHCGKRFKAHSVYNHHLLTHSDVRAYKCPFCPKAFKTSVQLAGHKNCHTKPFSCQQCNRPFSSLYAVRVHTETHNRQNNLKFSCTLCGASYARAFALKDHISQVHENAVVVS